MVQTYTIHYEKGSKLSESSITVNIYHHVFEKLEMPTGQLTPYIAQ